MHPDYLLLRMIRHWMPSAAMRFLLRKEWLVKPGIETRQPLAAVADYQAALASVGQSLAGKRVLLFGYGGNFSLGCLLLEAGAAHVVLCDRYAPPNHQANALLLPQYEKYLLQSEKTVLPRPEVLSLLQADIRNLDGSDLAVAQPASPTQGFELCDLVFSRSVYEHLDDVEGVTAALVRLTRPGGWHVHFIDLSDHFFKYPFEMLTYAENTWRKWLNPTSNLNRLRYGDYQRLFNQYLTAVNFTVMQRQPAAFEQARSRIRPEFLSGDPHIDAITYISVTGAVPLLR
jgi:SAM-dependent methyltransferase